MADGGGAWDNAKKFIEGGRHGGKGGEAHRTHKTAVVGDPCQGHGWPRHQHPDQADVRGGADHRPLNR